MAIFRAEKIRVGAGDLAGTYTELSSGTAAPNPSDGNDGDLYVQVNGSQSELFIKKNSTWLPVSNQQFSATLTDNTVGGVWALFDATLFSSGSLSSVLVHYDIVRGANRRSGIFQVSSDGVTTQTTEYGVTSIGASVGVTFSADVSGGNVRFLYTTDNQGISGTVTYVVTAGASITEPTSVTPVTRGGTGFSSYAVGDTLYASGTTALSKLPIGTVSYIMMSVAGLPAWGQIVDASVAIAAAINRAKMASGGLNHVLINDGAGAMSSEAALSPARGGLGVSNNAAATLTRSGNHAVTLTTAGVTSLTLPTSGSVAVSDNPDELRNLSLANSVATSAMTINLNDAAAATASATSLIPIAFRSATAATGTYVLRSVFTSLSIIIPSTATLGHVSGKNEYIYVYLLDNAGMVELAVSSFRFDEGSLQTTTTISGSATSRTVMYSTVGRSNVAVRLIGRLKSNQTVAGTWAAVALESAIFTSRSQAMEISQAVAYNFNAGAAKLGTSNTSVLRFASNIVSGTSVTYADSSSAGGSFTVNDYGIYSISATAGTAVNKVGSFGLSINGTHLSAAPDGLAYPEVVALSYAPMIAGDITIHSLHWEGRLSPGDVIRLQGATTAASYIDNDTRLICTVTKTGD